jgi:aspartate/methionine/tyrosine aminotransferase
VVDFRILVKEGDVTIQERLAERVQAVQLSSTVSLGDKVQRLREAGERVINMASGRPNFDTPRHIKDAANQALYTPYKYIVYTESKGLWELREAIAEKLERENGVAINPATQLLVTVGSKEALFILTQATLNPGDEVIITDPSWVTYQALVLLAGGKPVRVPLEESDKFQLEPQAVEERITDRTKMIIINSPNNPTGSVLDEAKLTELAEIALSNELLIVSDEIYEKIVYDGAEHRSIRSFPGMDENSVLINGLSKAYAMTGWRIGYIAAAEELISKMLIIHQHSITCACAFAQKGAVAGLSGPQRPVADMVEEYRERREYIWTRLRGLEGISCLKPQGTFYFFPNIDQLGMSSVEVAEFLLEEAKVALVPGSSFGEKGEGFLRLSYANVDLETLEIAFDQIAAALASARGE